MESNARAFMSYARPDDQHGRLSLLRRRLNVVLREHRTAEEIDAGTVCIVQGSIADQWGEEWQERLSQPLAAPVFLLPILTPAFFGDPQCREELEHILKQEQLLGRNDLVIPIYYTRYAPLERRSHTDPDTHRLIQALIRHHPIDLHEISTEPFLSANLLIHLDKISEHIQQAQERPPQPATLQSDRSRFAQAIATPLEWLKKLPSQTSSKRDWPMILVGMFALLLLLVIAIYLRSGQAAIIPSSAGPTVTPTRSLETAAIPARPTEIPAPAAPAIATPVPGAAPRSPNQIAFTSNRDGNQEVYVINASGGSPRNLTQHPAEDSGPAWSPDGRYIAFASDRDGSWDIFVMDADGSTPRNLTRSETGEIEPDWSPDGTRLAFISDRDGSQNLYVLDIQSGSVQQITSDLEVRNPAWSPDGTRLAYTSVYEDNPEIYIINADGSNPRRLTNERLKDAEPDWMPDGRIVFVSWRDNDGELYRMNAEGSSLQQLTFESNSNDWDPACSPDGQAIAFVSTRSAPEGRADIYIIRADASDTNTPRSLTSHPADDYSPDWCCMGTGNAP